MTFEGFGMPVLEAMAAGVPPGISRIEPLASLAGAHAAVEFDPESDDEILAGMQQLVGRAVLSGISDYLSISGACKSMSGAHAFGSMRA